MIVFLKRNYISLSLAVAVPVRLFVIHKSFLVLSVKLPAGLIKKIEFKFGKDKHLIGYSRFLHIIPCSKHNIAGILGKRSVVGIIYDHYITRHG